MGDVAMTLPVLYAVARAYPRVHFIMYTRERFARIVWECPPNVEMRGVDLKQYAGWRGLLRLGRELANEHFDLFIDLHRVLRTTILSILLRLRGVPCQHIRKGRFAKWCTLHHIGHAVLPSTIERYADTFRRAGLTAFSYTPSPHHEGHGIGIAPFAQHMGKIYPLDRMEEVVRLLSERGEPIYLFGFGKEETSVLERWAERYPNVISLAGKHSLEEEMNIMHSLRVMISMDSANMHLASLVGTRVVSIWGATHPCMGFLGWGQNEHDCVQLPLPCRPCSVYGNRPCRYQHLSCLQDITPQQIAAHV